MLVAHAILAFLFDVANLAAGRHLAIAPDDTATTKSRETEKSNETHAVLFAFPGSEAVGASACDHRRTSTSG
jgi:hypothetical protein